jgi:hypothetical protein
MVDHEQADRAMEAIYGGRMLTQRWAATKPLHAYVGPEAEPWRWYNRLCGYVNELGDRNCDKPALIHPPGCGWTTDTEYGPYVCDVVSTMPHHSCGYHHGKEATCDQVEQWMEAEASLLRYAR